MSRSSVYNGAAVAKIVNEDGKRGAVILSNGRPVKRVTLKEAAALQRTWRAETKAERQYKHSGNQEGLVRARIARPPGSSRGTRLPILSSGQVSAILNHRKGDHTVFKSSTGSYEAAPPRRPRGYGLTGTAASHRERARATRVAGHRARYPIQSSAGPNLYEPVPPGSLYEPGYVIEPTRGRYGGLTRRPYGPTD